MLVKIVQSNVMKTKLWLLIIYISFIVSIITAQDIWDDENGEIFTDKKILPSGTIVKIIFDNELVASYQSSLSTMNRKQAGTPEINSEYFNFLPDIAVTKSDSADTDTEISREENIDGKISAQLQNFNKKTGNYTVRASHTVVINGRDEKIDLAALVAGDKIKSDKTVKSEDLANVRLVFTGVMVQKQKETVTEDDFSSLEFITKASNESSLTPEKKKQLFIDYFNMILKELF